MEVAVTEADWAQAAANFHKAATILRSIGKLIMAYEAEIGLAELAHRRGDIQAALQQIVPILSHLPTVAAAGWDEPLRVYVVCTQILRVVQDPMAEKLLAQGLQLLEYLAQNIADPDFRQNFLQAVPAHRKLRTLQLGERTV
jgi:hypothetical protein